MEKIYELLGALNELEVEHTLNMKSETVTINGKSVSVVNDKYSVDGKEFDRIVKLLSYLKVEF